MKKQFVAKQDLAVAYFPHIDCISARHKLCNLIHDDKTLFRHLVKIGYKKTCRYFSPNQQELIFDRLGKPY